MADNYEERKSAVLEGMYKGVERKIDEVKQSVTKELQYSSEQQAGAHEALAESFQQAIEAVLNELRYLAQQNSAIYDYGKKERAKEKEDILKAFDDGMAANEKRLAEAEDKLSAAASSRTDDYNAERIDALIHSLGDQIDRMGRMFDDKLESLENSINEKIDARARELSDELRRQSATAEQLDYLCRILPAQIEGLHRTNVESDVLETREIRYDDRFQRDLRENIRSDLRAELRDYGYTAAQQTKNEQPRSYDGAFDDSFDYGVLAEKIVSMLPETDYDLIADRVVAALPQTDENALADKIVASIPQTDENAIADRIADAVPLTDYDLIAEKVATVMEHEFDVTVDEAGISRIAASVAEELDYDRIAARVMEFVRAGESEAHAEINSEAVADKVAQLLGETQPVAVSADEIATRVVEMMKENAELQPQGEAQPAEQYAPNYDELAQHIAEILREDAPIPVVDYDRIAQQVVYGLRMDEQVRAEDSITEDGVATRVVELLQANEVQEEPFTVDYDLIASKVAATIRADMPHTSADGSENFTADDIAGRVVTLIHEREAQEETQELTADEIAQKVAEILAAQDAEAQPEEVQPLTADEVATRVLEMLQESEAEEEPLELDYDEIASKVAEAIRGELPQSGENVPASEISATDVSALEIPTADEIAQKVAEALAQQEKVPQELDYDQMAVRVAQCVRMVHEEPDYDRIASRVSDYLKAEQPAEAVSTGTTELDYDLLAEKITERVGALGNSADEIAQKVADLFAEDEPLEEDAPQAEAAEIDYDLLAEKVAEALRTEGISEPAQALTADDVARRVLELMKESGLIDEEEFEEDAEQVGDGAREEFARQIAELRASTEELKAAAERIGDGEVRSENVAVAGNAESWNAEEIAERVAELMKYDELAAKLYEQLSAEDIAAHVVELLNTENVASGPVEGVPTADEIAQKVAELFAEDEPLEEEASELPTADDIAARVVELLNTEGFAPQATEAINADEIAQKVVEAIEIPAADISTDEIATKIYEQLNAEEIAARVVELLKTEGIAPQTTETLNADEIAAKVAEAINVPETEVPVDEIVQKVAALFAEDEAEEEGETEIPTADEIAQKVAEVISIPTIDLSADEIAQKVTDLLKEELPVRPLAEEELAVAAEPEPEPEPEPVEEEEEEEEEVVAPAPKAKPQAKASPKKPQPTPDPVLTTRLKRSFTAKLIESEEDVKDYYSELKNQLLSYVKVKSQINWSNDRFTYNHESIAKIGLRGKTLCLYLALNPEEFPTTVYHQKFAGDTKMYEKTPMLVKIKSTVALKRSLKLVELLMEHVQAVKGERKTVDYATKYAYRSEEQLLAEGLIKAVLTEKSKLDF